jgi:diketogulonate reductase-like aldo/keto reductase
VAIENGITHLDGAQMYGNEESLGQAIKASGKSRSELYIVTKLKPTIAANETVKGLLIESLKKLGLDFVDLFLVHSPHPSNKEEGKLLGVWKQMEQVQKDGLAKSIGVSNFRVEDLQIVLEGGNVVPAVNQVRTISLLWFFYSECCTQIELHPYVWKAAEPIVTLCRERGITIASYGGLTPLVRAPGGPVDETLATIAKQLSSEGTQVSTSQVLTKWNLQKGGIVVTYVTHLQTCTLSTHFPYHRG